MSDNRNRDNGRVLILPRRKEDDHIAKLVRLEKLERQAALEEEKLNQAIGEVSTAPEKAEKKIFRRRVRLAKKIYARMLRHHQDVVYDFAPREVLRVVWLEDGRTLYFEQRRAKFLLPIRDYPRHPSAAGNPLLVKPAEDFPEAFRKAVLSEDFLKHLSCLQHHLDPPELIEKLLKEAAV